MSHSFVPLWPRTRVRESFVTSKWNWYGLQAINILALSRLLVFKSLKLYTNPFHTKMTPFSGTTIHPRIASPKFAIFFLLPQNTQSGTGDDGFSYALSISNDAKIIAARCVSISVLLWDWQPIMLSPDKLGPIITIALSIFLCESLSIITAS